MSCIEPGGLKLKPILTGETVIIYLFFSTEPGTYGAQLAFGLNNFKGIHFPEKTHCSCYLAGSLTGNVDINVVLLSGLLYNVGYFSFLFIYFFVVVVEVARAKCPVVLCNLPHSVV